LGVRDDFVTPFGMRGQLAVEAHEMTARVRNQGREAGQEIHGLEEKGFGSVGPRAAELVEDAAIGELVQSVQSEGRASDVPAQVLQALAVAGGDAHVSVQAEAIEAGTAAGGQGGGRRRVRAHTAEGVASTRAQGHVALYGGAVAGGQQRGLFSPGIGDIAGLIVTDEATTLEQAQDTQADGEQDVGDVVVGGFGGGVKDGRRLVVGAREDAIEDERVKMRGQIE
jgi:hypothetical protein